MGDRKHLTIVKNDSRWMYLDRLLQPCGSRSGGGSNTSRACGTISRGGLRITGAIGRMPTIIVSSQLQLICILQSMVLIAAPSSPNIASQNNVLFYDVYVASGARLRCTLEKRKFPLG